MSFAISYPRFGGAEVLAVDDITSPAPGKGQILISVRAIGVNPVDAKIRRGELAAAFTPAFPVVPGIDAAGIVTAIGTGVTDVSLGDEVFGIAAQGSYAAEAVLAQWVRKPAAVAWELAAALPSVGEAAFRALGHLAVADADRLLIHGAAGSVGSIATRLAVGRGVTVIGTARPDDLDFVRSLGATAIPYGPGLVERVLAVSPGGVDAVLDASGAGVLPESIELAGGPQRVITIADESAFALGVRFTGADPADRDRTALAQLATLASEGRIGLRTISVRPLAEAPLVHAELDAGTLRGKIVLLP